MRETGHLLPYKNATFVRAPPVSSPLMRRTVTVMHLFCCYITHTVTHKHTNVHRGWFTTSIYFMNVIKHLQLFCVGGKCCLCVLWKVYSSGRCCCVLTRGHRLSLMCQARMSITRRACWLWVCFPVFFHSKSFHSSYIVKLPYCSKTLVFFNPQQLLWKISLFKGSVY